MANVKITQLPSATTPLTGTEVFPLVQGTTTKQVAITGLFTSPVMSNPTLGVVGQADLINATGLPIASGVSGLGAGIATFLGTPSSANLRTAVTDETGSGALVFANTPVLVAPNLGTPTFLVATNATGTAVGLTAGSAITNANLTGAVTSVGNATSLGSFTSAQLRTALTDKTGAGSAVFATSPTITAPILNQINDTNNAQILGLSPTTSAVDYLVVKNGIGVGVPLHFYADGSSANIGLHIQPKGTGLVTISDGTDFNKGIRFRSSSSAASAITLLDAVSTAGRVVTLPDATTTLVGRDTTDTLTNKTIAFSSNTFSGTLAIANGGTNASTAASAIENLLPAYAGNGSKGLRLNSGATALEWVADGGGTVTSVAATVPSFLSIAGSPITTSGTLAFSLSGTALPTTSGGTGLTSFTSGGVVYASSTSALATGSNLYFDGTHLGVGTTSPSTYGKLVVNGSFGILNGAPSYFYNSGNTSYASIACVDTNSIAFTNGATEGLSLTSTSLYTASGINVGIGTSNPQRKIDAQSTTADYQLRLGYNSSFYYDIGRVNSNGYLGFYGSQTNATGYTFGGVDGTWATINSTGNMGLGVIPVNAYTGLAYKNFELPKAAFFSFDVTGSRPIMGLKSNVYYDSGGNTLFNGNGYAVQYLTDTGNHQWYTSTISNSSGAGASCSLTQAMTLDASGNLGVGTTSPNSPAGSTQITLHVSNSTAGTSPGIHLTNGDTGTTAGDGTLIFVGNAASTGTTSLNIYNQESSPICFFTATAERARIDSSGNLLVGTTTSTGNAHILQTSGSGIYSTQFISSTSSSPYGSNIYFSGASPNGTSNQFLYCNDSSALRMEVRSNGGIANYSANNVNLSDRREKTNFAPATSYLDKICAIPVQTFNYIDQNLETDDGLTLGVVAQDVQAVAPELVMESNWGTQEEPKMRLSIYQTDLQYALMKALQELKAEFDAYKASHP